MQLNPAKYLLLFMLFLAGFVSNAADLDNLLPNERNTINVFHDAASKVVYVHRLAKVHHYSYENIRVTTGTGSGIIWDNKGHIVTNYHVVKGADVLSVTMGNNTVPVKVIGVEPRKDIAVLKITSRKALKRLEPIKPFNLAKTSDLMVGQKAIAIGNPYGLDHTLTTGVVSALGRQLPGIGGVSIHDMIQTDASINPGNSGGPLLDSQGQLIGMNTAIYSTSGSSAGIGFAVPADDIQRIVPQLIKNGRVVLAGIGIQRVLPNIAVRLGVKKGILIGEVLPHTPAAKAGLRATVRDQFGRIILGDIIVGLNGHPVSNYDDLYNLLVHVKVGDEVTITINRHGKKIDYKIKTIDIAAY